MCNEQLVRRCLAMACGVALLLAARTSDAGLQPRDGWGNPVGVEAGAAPAGGASDRFVHRLRTRTENSAARLREWASTTGTIWVWFLGSVFMFLMVTVLSSVVDLRMLALRRQGPGALSRYLGRGTRTFFRLLWDRRTPHMARLLLGGALVYWLVPLDLIPDDTLVPGFVDDVLVAVSAAQGFMYLCPDTLVAQHAAAVEARA